MGIITLPKCPHCYRKAVIGMYTGERPLPVELWEGYIESMKKSPKWRDASVHSILTTFFCCQSCGKGITATIACFSVSSPRTYEGNIDQNNLFLVHELYPEPPDNICPEYSPENAIKLYPQFAENLKSKYYDSCVSIGRKILDIATKALDTSAKELNLVKRINKLCEDGVITKDLKEWAHAVRLIGNETLHEDSLTSKEDAEDLYYFVEAFLTYTFTLPNRLKERMHRKKGEED